MANLETKYLDYNGLNIFLQKLKEYISGRITEISGSNLNLYSSGDTNPTITSQIEDLWGAIGSSEGANGSLAENIANILGQYVKDIKNPETQTLPIKIKVEEGVDSNKDIYIISLIDNGLTETLEDLNDNRVSKLDTQNTVNNLVTISCDKNTGDVKLTVNDAGLLEVLENIQSNLDENELVCAEALTNLDSRLKVIEDGFGGIASNYVKSIKATGSDGITATPTTAANGEVEITISGLGLKEEINDVKSNYLKTSDVPTKLPNPNKLTITDANGNAIEYDGSVAKDIDSISHSKTSDTASDSNKLGGKDPSYYATKESVENITSNYVKSIKATGSNGITAAPATAANGEVEITISGSGLEEEINDIKSNYLKTSDVPTKLPNPNKLTIIDANGNVIEYDGSVAKDINSISHSKTSDTASDSDKLDGKDPSYYATKESVDDITSSYVKSIKATGSDGITVTPATANNGEVEITISGSGLKEEINDIKSSIDENEEVCAEALTNLDSRLKVVEDGVGGITSNYVKSIKAVGSNGIIATPTTTTNGTVTITISGLELKEGIENINNYAINNKKISENPSLTGNDITLGVSVGDNTNYPTTQTISASIQILRETIAGLGQVMELKGILTSLPETTTGYGNGDVIIVGSEEYVCYESNWYLLGHTTEIEEGLESLISLYNGHKHAINIKGSIESDFTGTQSSTDVSTKTVEINNVTNVGSLPTMGDIEVAAKDHTHDISVVAKGAIESDFTGTRGSTNASTNTVNINNVTDVGSLPTLGDIKVAAKDHTHNISVMAKGAVENTCNSEQKDTTFSDITSSYNVGVLTITTSHYHNYNQTTSVTSTFTGESVSVTSGIPSATEEVKQITGVGSLPTIQSVTVSASDHTHNYTPTGTIESTFTGESVSVTSDTPSATEEVKQITGVGSLPTIQSVTVSASDHTHNYTPTGTVGSNIDISVDTGEPDSKFTTE